jgi:hypothetical protein
VHSGGWIRIKQSFGETPLKLKARGVRSLDNVVLPDPVDHFEEAGLDIRIVEVRLCPPG